jgi:hypothetical protein
MGVVAIGTFLYQGNSINFWDGDESCDYRSLDVWHVLDISANSDNIRMSANNWHNYESSTYKTLLPCNISSRNFGILDLILNAECY